MLIRATIRLEKGVSIHIVDGIPQPTCYIEHKSELSNLWLPLRTHCELSQEHAETKTEEVRSWCCWRWDLRQKFLSISTRRDWHSWWSLPVRSAAAAYSPQPLWSGFSISNLWLETVTLYARRINRFDMVMMIGHISHPRAHMPESGILYISDLGFKPQMPGPILNLRLGCIKFLDPKSWNQVFWFRSVSNLFDCVTQLAGKAEFDQKVK